jgi:hypothetical protein
MTANANRKELSMATDLLSLMAPERNRYFYGLMMDADRFQKDQDYFNRRSYLLNRLVNGSGVVAGLGLTWNSGGPSLTLRPGVAIDAAGREIVVPSDTAVDITQLTDTTGKPTGPVPDGATLLISIAYREKNIDPVPVLVPDCDHPNACATATVQENFAIIVTAAAGPPPPAPGCVFGTFPLPPGAALQQAIEKQIENAWTPAPADPSIVLARLDLAAGTLDAVSDRPVVCSNTLLAQMIVCLAGEVARLQPASLIYVSGDNQTANANTALANPIVVALVDGSGNPVTGGPPPVFTVASGGGSLAAVTSSAPGQYQTKWTLGASGAQAVKVTDAQSTLTVTFNATIQP